MLIETIDTLIIGGGQAGLTISHGLKKHGIRHLCIGATPHRRALAQRAVGRFDVPVSKLVATTARFKFPQDNPDAFATPAEIIKFIEDYAQFVDPPIRCGVEGTKLRGRKHGTFLAETTRGNIVAKNVVVATGPYQRALQPSILQDHAELFQVHASSYEGPAQLPDGAVLVIGASGAQIAEELARAGRQVLLSVERHQRLPRRYRGHDVTWWLTELGIDRTPVERRDPSRLQPITTAAYCGHTLDFRRFLPKA